MASTIVGICNIALTSLGANPITSLSEGSTESVLASTMYDSARRSILRIHPWNFALKRYELAQTPIAPTYGYTYAYILPADCLRLIQVLDDLDYKLENRRILTNASTVFVKGVCDITDVGLWDESFKDLIAARLRYDMAYAITRSNTQVSTAFEIYKDKLQTAKAIDASEDVPDVFGHFESNFVASRF